MMLMPTLEVIPAGDARRDLPKYLKAFRQAPEEAEPVVFGPHRKAEAVLLSIEQYRAMVARIEELSVRAEIADVLARDTGERGDIAELARRHGFDPSEYGLG